MIEVCAARSESRPHDIAERTECDFGGQRLRIDISRSNSWIRVSEQCRSALPFHDSAVIVQAYMGLPHALYEATQGLARLYSHKKTIAVVAPVEPIVESILIGFSEEGYTLKYLTEAEAADPSGSWLTAIANDLVFIIWSNDDPVTGRLYDRSALDEVLKDKRVFRVSLNHSPCFLPQSLTRPAPFETRILAASDDLAVVVAGERFRVSPLIAKHMPWREESADIQLKPIQEAEVELLKKKILDFESKLPTGFKAYFSASEQRIYDRAVFYNESLDGSALIELLARSTGQELVPAGRHNTFEALSPCRWNDQRLLDWLLKRGEKESVIRGLVLIDARTLNDELPKKLEESAAALLKMQTGGMS